MHSHLVERLGWNVCQEENRVGSVHVAEMECVGGSQGWQCACGWNGVCVGGSQGQQRAWDWNGAWSLAGFPQLHTLSLEETGVTDQGLVQYFATKPCLKNLNLNRTSVTNDIFTHLQSESIYSRYFLLVFFVLFFFCQRRQLLCPEFFIEAV